MSTTTFAYRDPSEGARLRFRTMLERLGLDDEKVARAAGVHGRRTGRIWAGTTGILIMTAVAAGAAYIGLFAQHRGYFGLYAGNDHLGSPLTLLLLSAWPAMAVAYVLGRAWSVVRTSRDREVMRETDNACADLARLEAGWKRTDVSERANMLERGSVTLPLIALALLSPLTIHWMFCTFTGQTKDFDTWIMLSLLIVGHAHLVLAWQGARFAKKALDMSTDEVRWARSRAQWAAYGWTVLASALPGAFLFLIPPILTAVTGFIVAPLMFNLATHWIDRDRRDLFA